MFGIVYQKNFTSNIYKTILEQFKKYEIAYFLYIGGNDSMDTVLKLSEYFKEISFDCKVIGVPKTIDNDLAMTDHSPGYGSAINLLVQQFKKSIMIRIAIKKVVSPLSK